MSSSFTPTPNPTALLAAPVAAALPLLPALPALLPPCGEVGVGPQDPGMDWEHTGM